ncbi:hypothetical protein GGX14DRAFT_574108 [Mycena pura]|uniref:Uncharacterized protein n=1 Tax=Mycena pura TaxID=153505 RepID=A0AAD6UXR6_9AGAR|nr:hypothetical protein GGX14DRAFT_574108 [Mycena pura]
MVRMLFITSPGSIRPEPNVESTDWAPQWITRQEEQAYFDDETAGLFLTEWSTKDSFVTGAHPGDHCPVFLHESLLMAIRWSRHADVDLQIVSFKHFAQVALMGDGRVLKEYGCRFDIVYGGCEYTTDRVEAGDFRNRQDELRYIARMEVLARSVLVWPPPQESFFYRQKLALIRRLEEVAECTTWTSRPKTSILLNKSQFTECTVLKREGSDQSKRRIFHDSCRNPQKTATDLCKSNQKILAKRQKKPDDLEAKHGMLWMVQDLVPELRKYGEYRVYVVAGKVVSVVGTTPTEGGWCIKDCHGVYGLTELTPEVLANPEPHDVLVRQGGTRALLEKATKALHDYVLMTHKALIQKAESESPGASSVLREFARIDVSVMRKLSSEAGYDYFVNEVEIPNGIYFFSQHSDGAERVMDELLEALLTSARSRFKFDDQRYKFSSDPTNLNALGTSMAFHDDDDEIEIQACDWEAGLIDMEGQGFERLRVATL